MIGIKFIWVVKYLGLYTRYGEEVFTGDNFHCMEVEVSKLIQQNKFPIMYYPKSCFLGLCWTSPDLKGIHMVASHLVIFYYFPLIHVSGSTICVVRFPDQWV